MTCSVRTLVSNSALTGCQLVQMTRHCQPGANIAQQHGAKQQRKTVGRRYATQGEIATVKSGQTYYSIVQPIQPEGQQQPGEDAGTETIERAHIKEGTPHVAIGSTYQ